MKNILITGCAGFIGSSFLKSIINKNYKIIGIDDLSTGNIKNLPKDKKFRFIKGDCGDSNILNKIKDNVDIIYHFAGQSSGEKSFYDPINDIDRNLFSTIKLLNFYLKKKSRQFIYASSMSVYGNKNKKVSESDSCNPISFYGLSKLSSENFISMFAKKKVNYTILRFFNVYGEGQSLDNLRQGMIRIYLTQILKNKNLIVKGSTRRFRDFIYIEDVNKILEKLIANKRCYNQVFNVGFGKKYTVNQVINLIKKKIKKKFKVKIKPNTPYDQFGIYSDNRKLITTIKYKPKYSLSEGLDKFLISKIPSAD